MVIERIQEIHEKGKIPIIEGGSGFYLNFLLTSDDIMFDDEVWKSAMEKAIEITDEIEDWDKL